MATSKARTSTVVVRQRPKLLDSESLQPYFCVLCKSLLYEPYQLTCGDRACCLCLKDFAKKIKDNGLSSTRCPGCGDQISHEQFFPDKAATRELNALSVSCPNEGCQWEGLYEEYFEIHYIMYHRGSDVQFFQQEAGGDQPSELVTGRCNILPPYSAYDKDAVQTVLGGRQQLPIFDSGVGTWSSQMDGLEDPSHHTTLTETQTQPEVPHPQQYFSTLTERFHANPLSHLLVLGEGPLIPRGIGLENCCPHFKDMCPSVGNLRHTSASSPDKDLPYPEQESAFVITIATKTTKLM